MVSYRLTVVEGILVNVEHNIYEKPLRIRHCDSNLFFDTRCPPYIYQNTFKSLEGDKTLIKMLI